MFQTYSQLTFVTWQSIGFVLGIPILIWYFRSGIFKQYAEKMIDNKIPVKEALYFALFLTSPLTLGEFCAIFGTSIMYPEAFQELMYIGIRYYLLFIGLLAFIALLLTLNNRREKKPKAQKKPSPYYEC